jgi:hypothetical protein
LISQNGYYVLETNRTTGPLPRLRKWHVPGVDRHIFLRDGSGGFLLVYLALWFHENIEKLDAGIWDEWGWAVRPVRGQSSGYSNHASGTAEDLNATKHPRGVPTRNTFSSAEIDEIHKHLATYDGCIRWGGDYQNTPDGMHFELNKDLAAVEKKARELSQTPRGQRILEANPGADDVIWDGKPPRPVPADLRPDLKPAPKPAPKPAEERLGADWSYARPNPQAVKAAGIRGVIRYVSPKVSKNLTKSEAAAIHRAGLWIALVWERRAARAREGAAAGREDARAAEAQATALGYPRDATIFYAVDYDAEPSVILPYFRGINAVAKRPVGVYGSARVIDAVKAAKLADYFWQTLAWSHGRVSGAANWLQRTSKSAVIKGSKATDWDENLLIGGNVPVWKPKASKPVPKPAPKPSPKPTPHVPEIVKKPAPKPAPTPSPKPEPAPEPEPDPVPEPQPDPVPPVEPTTKVWFNDPTDPTKYRVIVDRLAELAARAQKGDSIRGSVFSFSDGSLQAALTAAARRGAVVQITIDGHCKSWPAVQRLTDTLAKVGNGSRVVSTVKSARGNGGFEHAKFWLFSQEKVALVGSSNCTGTSQKLQWSSMIELDSRDDVYDRLVLHHDEMLADVRVTPPQRLWTFGEGPSVEVWANPRPGAQLVDDPIVNLLKSVQDKHVAPAEGPRLAGLTVRSAYHGWSGDRGIWVAQKLSDMVAAGAHVQAIGGVGIGKNVRNFLVGGGVEYRAGYQSVLASIRKHIHWKFTGATYLDAEAVRHSMICDGSDNATPLSLHWNDELQIVLWDDFQAYDSWWAQFDKVWSWSRA